jgi:hypothetical protein
MMVYIYYVRAGDEEEREEEEEEQGAAGQQPRRHDPHGGEVRTAPVGLRWWCVSGMGGFELRARAPKAKEEGRRLRMPSVFSGRRRFREVVVTVVDSVK